MDELEQARSQVAGEDSERVHLLLLESERLYQVLMSLVAPLMMWRVMEYMRSADLARYMDEAYQQMHENLAKALCDVTDALAHDGTQRSAQQLADQVLAELRAEQPAHKSLARLRLNRLRSCIEDWWAQDIQDDEREMLVAVCTELLLLCQHLGITGKQPVAGGAA
jgi:hypothetical protein